MRDIMFKFIYLYIYIYIIKMLYMHAIRTIPIITVTDSLSRPVVSA